MDTTWQGTPTLVDPMQAEPVSDPPPRRRGAALRILAGVLFAASLIAASVAVGEWAARTDEMAALIGEIAESEAAMTEAMDAVFEVIGPEGALAETEAAEAQEQLRQAALRGQEQIAAAELRINEVPIQPWHDESLAARDAYLAHNRAWQDFLGRAADEPSLWLTSDEDIEATWDALAPVLTAAVPTPDFLGLDEKVANILQDGGGDNGGGGPTLDT